MIYDNLDKDSLIELLFKADTTIQALADRDEAREALEKERAKHLETARRLDSTQRIMDRLRDKVAALDGLPSYHQTLEKLCTEFGVPGSPSMGEVIAFVKKRLGRK